MSAGDLAFRLGRRIGKHPLAGRLFCLTERFLPLNRVIRRDDLVAFHHPRPIADPHLLIVPTQPVPSITTKRIHDNQRARLIWRMVDLGREVASHLPSTEHWHMTINGGHRQDIGQLHAHLLHTRAEHSHARLLEDPEIDPHSWQDIFSELRDADRVPGNGYSVEIRWKADGSPTLRVTQSPRT